MRSDRPAPPSHHSPHTHCVVCLDPESPLSITESTLPLRPLAADRAAARRSESPLSHGDIIEKEEEKKAVCELKKSIRMCFMLGPAEKCRAEIYTLFDVRLPAVNW